MEPMGTLVAQGLEEMPRRKAWRSAIAEYHSALKWAKALHSTDPNISGQSS